MVVASHDKKYDFSGKVALITGSSSGIGAAIATQFAQYGAQLTITGLERDELNKVATKIQQFTGHKPLQLVGDLRDCATPRKLIQGTIERYDRLDVLVNCAGMATTKTIDSEGFIAAYDSVLTVNVRTALELIHLATPYLEQTKGCVVNISSTASLYPLGMIYSISKAAMDMLTKTAARELGSKNIRVNSIHPGIINTNFTRFMGYPNVVQNYPILAREHTVLDRVGQPEDVANLASFLASDDARNMTGSMMITDGGMLIRNNTIDPIRTLRVVATQIWHNLTRDIRKCFGL